MRLSPVELSASAPGVFVARRLQIAWADLKVAETQRLGIGVKLATWGNLCSFELFVRLNKSLLALIPLRNLPTWQYLQCGMLLLCNNGVEPCRATRRFAVAGNNQIGNASGFD